jgi:predicted AAA+ superfamily ATPase
MRRSGKSAILALLREELLERIVKFLMDNMGRIFSAKSISDFLRAQG